ncbi:related to Sls2 [Lecanosticta acicola]|uniref:Related to Sls2 n=1 Tax=Lecanosticta acicola TaxID=111012 RepID=A0AAI8Z8W8_9PEZI|nr:related to Sls2 [Lecanosticta acicola]
MSGRSTPLGHTKSARHSRNLSQLEHLKKVQIHGQASGSNEHVFSSLRATQMVDSKPVLPAELIATILDYLPVSDLLRFARVSRRLQEMVYDDTRWIQKLKQMGAWNETEARQRVEEAMKRKTEAQLARQTDEWRRTGVNQIGGENGSGGTGRKHAGSVTLFDAGVEEQKYRTSLEAQQSPQTKRRGPLADGFEALTISGSPASLSTPLPGSVDPHIALTIFRRVRSIRGQAKQEFGKVYSALASIYFDLARSKGHSDALIFRTYRDPEQQAQILSNLKRFAQCDLALGWAEREGRLDDMIGVFESAVLREFDQGYAADDVPGRMHRYAHVLVTLNGGKSGIELYMSNHPILNRTSKIGNPLDCLQDVAWGHVDFNPSQRFFEQLAGVMVQQADIIDRVFPQTVDVLTPFWTRLCDDIISEYIAALFDEAHAKGTETYVKAVAGNFGQALRLAASLKPTKAAPADFLEKAKNKLIQCYEKHFDLYLSEEYGVFRLKAELDVTQWEKEMSDQEASTESFFMSNVNRQAAKRDFLSSFKKVVMMPVNAFPMSSPFASAKSATAASRSSANLDSIDTAYPSARPATPTLAGSGTTTPRAAAPQQDPPSTELAAKAAIMNSRLEGIKSLFSIEVALNLTHLAKASLERAATMVQMGGSNGEEAKKQCEKIFVTLLDILGNRHVKKGFDKAVTHLSSYNPREVRKFKQETQGGGQTSQSAHIGVEPLVTFLELVNVGDLIQQMVDVFYSQELIATKLTERDDFLDPAVKEKKKFEQMLDERVAAGLNKGIDVLMDEVDYICATTQQPTDFNPGKEGIDDIGPSATAKQVVDMVSGHTGMLVGSTDKNMLDVFNQEVGLRLFGALCKHFKRQRTSVDGAIRLISDINHYSTFIGTLRQKPLLPYYEALREMSQIYLVHIDPPTSVFGGGSGSGGKRGSFLTGAKSSTSLQAKELATIIADSQRYHGIFSAEEVYEFAERRADWYLVRGDVERAMYGVGCVVM